MMIRAIERWRKGESGVAIMEAAIIFPVLFLMLFGVYDVGHAITTNHKMITASNVIADLMTRGQYVNDSEIDQAIEAGRLAMSPYVLNRDDMMVYIASVRFDNNDNPVVVWDQSFGGIPDDDEAVDRARGLGTSGEGVMVVSLVFDYRPTFGNAVLERFRMREIAYARGRRSSVVERE
jgi:Flp pilus assembly protein TadG